MAIILDLCGGTGEWSRPYRLAGYDVRIVTMPDRDVCTYEPPSEVQGILAAPPCTEFAVSGARWWATKPTHLLEGAIRVVRACLRIIEQATPAWWVIENPVGRLAKCVPELGAPTWTFDPCDYGDPWTKKTCLWGQFTAPTKQERPSDVGWCPGWRLGPSAVRQTLRSITPPGFAQAFFEANP